MRQLITLLILVGCGLHLSGCSPTFWHSDYMHGEQAQRFDVASARIALREQDDCCRDLAELPYQPLALAAEQRFVIDDSSARLTLGEGPSRVLAFEIPEYRVPLQLEMRSLITDSVFAPTLLLLDESFRVTRRLGNEELSVRHNKIYDRDSLYTQQLIMPDERYLVVYSTPAQQAAFTYVPHAATVYAQARRLAPSGIPDLEYRHAPLGNLVISLSKTHSRNPFMRWLFPDY